ncbi:hypothetical protein RD792_003995 [Penstemon davidsonii]|uniref:Cytochrome P450 n=1 Tax=Penstemon davidsonii TaxID=160366 RepID=A0ABR0DHD4_9LAMI|nr:hypothetical protein RD792_003995 [Penstemon davidsonii]
MLPFLLLLFPLFYFIYIYKHKKSSNSNSNPPLLPPGPTPWPILGNIHQLKTMSHVTLYNLAKSYGPLMSLKLGTKSIIIASSSTVALQILKVNDRVLSARDVPNAVPMTRSEIDQLSFWADPWIDQWKIIRTKCRVELFSSKGLDSQARMWEEKVMEMVKYLRGKEGMVVNVEELVFVTIFNVFGNAYFSRDFLKLEEEFGGNEVKGFIRGIIEAISALNVSEFIPFLGKFDFQGLRKKHKEMSIKMHSLWEPTVKERREKMESGHYSKQDFLDTLLEDGFTDLQINKLFEELFTAGIDTTTSTINRTITELLNNPDSMNKLQHELDTEFNQALLSNCNLLQLSTNYYLQACVKETLRLHPPAPLLLSRRAHETCQVMNYTIPQNARVFVNVWAIGRDPSMWDEPLEYRPEKFIDSSLDFKGNDFEFLPFGAGRRICPGLPMAAKIVPLVIGSLIRFFNWTLPPHGNDADVHEVLRATSKMIHPLQLIPTARK